MKQLLKPVLALGLMTASAAALTAPVAAQQVAPGVGVVNLPAVVANSNAFQAAQTQRPTTFAAQIQQAETRRQQIAAQLQPLMTKFNTDRQAATPDRGALQQQAAQIQQIEQSGQRELQQILAPVAASQAYVQEQIEDKLDEAVQAAAAKKGVTLILDAAQGQVIFAAANYNITQDVLAELNTLIPAAQLVPPQGWVPREVRQQQEVQAAAQAAQAAAPATQQPTGR
ncbi:OmpH family outer membrane protein [Altererythrobacter sp.]|nr:OmpH family outer membrane protein [Altererythrobacter sp.]